MILLFSGIFAISAAIFGYSGLSGKWLSQKDNYFIEEAQKAADAAQLYYLRDRDSGGGGRSFSGLSFRALGLGVDSLERKVDGGTISFDIISDDSLDIVAVAADGARWEARGITFDSRVIFNRP